MSRRDDLEKGMQAAKGLIDLLQTQLETVQARDAFWVGFIGAIKGMAFADLEPEVFNAVWVAATKALVREAD